MLLITVFDSGDTFYDGSLSWANRLPQTVNTVSMFENVMIIYRYTCITFFKHTQNVFTLGIYFTIRVTL